VTGFAADLFVHQVNVKGKLCVVLGAGGAARAAVWVLVNAGAQVAVFNRTESRAVDLAAHFAEYFPGSAPAAHDLASLPDFVRKLGRAPALIVNATSLGMWPHIDESPWPVYTAIPPEAVVYDMVYKPARTRFLQQARSGGARAIAGLGMLVRRGAAAFKLWTGKPAPLQIMAQAIADATASDMPEEGIKGI
jgi:shikimate dehydrogenase